VDCVKCLGADSFVSGSQDGSIACWNEVRKNPLCSLSAAHGLEAGTPRWIASLASLGSSGTFASGSYDGFVRIWSTMNNKIKSVGEVPAEGFVNGLAFSSRLIVTGCSREPRLGRWITLKQCRNKISIFRYTK
jgi:ribosomal RNA-processing protein 9